MASFYTLFKISAKPINAQSGWAYVLAEDLNMSTKVIQCSSCSKNIEVGKFTPNEQKCTDCAGPDSSATKTVECVGCGESIEIHRYASNTQYCNACEPEKKRVKSVPDRDKSRRPDDNAIPKVKLDKSELAEDIAKSIRNTAELIQLKIDKIKKDLLALDDTQIASVEVFTRREIYLYLLSEKGFDITENGILYKKYPDVQISLVFMLGIFYGFHVAFDDHDTDIIHKEQAYYKQMPTSARIDLDDLIIAGGLFNLDETDG